MLDALDQKILRIVQNNASLPLEDIAKQVGSTKSPVWTRLKRLKADGYIEREVAILNSEKLGLQETFFVAVKTSSHSQEWVEKFSKIIQDMPEVMEAYRMAGEIDYLLKVRVKSTSDFDRFYKDLVAQIELFDVTSWLSMERMKETNILKF